MWDTTSTVCFPLADSDSLWNAYHFCARIGSKDSPKLMDFAGIVEICLGCSDFHHFSTNLSGIVKKLYEKNVFAVFCVYFSKNTIPGRLRVQYNVTGTRIVQIVQIWRKDPQKEKIRNRFLGIPKDLGSSLRSGTHLVKSWIGPIPRDEPPQSPHIM